MEKAKELCKKGNELYQADKYQEGIKVFDEAIALAPDFGEAYARKAHCLRFLQKDLEAIELYNKAVSLGFSADPGLYQGLGLCLKALRRYEEAVQAYDKAINLSPKYADYYLNKGNTLMLWGKMDEALATFRKDLELRPGDCDTYCVCSGILQAQGKDGEAMQEYDKCLSKDPKYFKAQFGKGNLLLKQKKYEEAIQWLKGSWAQDNAHPGSNFCLASAYIALGNKEEAMKYYQAADKMKPTLHLHYLYRGQCYYALGQKGKALEDFKKAKELLETDTRSILGPQLINHIKTTLKAVLETEETVKQTDEEIKKLDQQNPVVQKFIKNIANLKNQQNQLQNKVVSKLNEEGSAQANQDIQELNKIKDEFKNQFNEMQKELSQLKNKVEVIDKKVTEIKNQIEDLREEVNNKMDDYNKMLNTTLDKQNLSPEAKEKIKGYFKAFVGTFASIHVTSQVIDSGQVQLDAGSNATTILSFIASFTPFIGSTLSDTVKTVGDFLKSQEMIKNARRMKTLAHDSTALSQLVGKAAYEIATDAKAQQKIINTTAEELSQISGNLFQKVMKFCENLSDKLDMYLYTELYKTPAERLGHNDANSLVEKWIKGSIDPYNAERQFVSEVLKEKHQVAGGKVPEPISETPKETIKHQNACCNLF